MDTENKQDDIGLGKGCIVGVWRGIGGGNGGVDVSKYIVHVYEIIKGFIKVC